MAERDQKPDPDNPSVGVNPGYAAFQIAKALITSEQSDDPATRARAKERISKWETVLKNILTGAVGYGSRTPVQGAPEWATLEVITGGFATGELLAGGSLQEHERAALKLMSGVPEGEERRALNAYYLTDSGLEELQNLLLTGCYDMTVPEEGALMVVAWLVGDGHTEDAREILEKLSPYFAKLRFYPIPLERPRRFGPRVHVQNIGETIEKLRGIKPNGLILAQKEAVEIWAPFHDRVVRLFLETIEDGWPCRKYPDVWPDRARALINEYAELRKQYKLCGKAERARGHSAQLRKYLGQCANEPNSLTGRDVGRIRFILNCYLAKRGAPDSPTCIAGRRRQLTDVSAPTFHAIAKVVVSRLEKLPKDDGVDDVSHLKEAITKQESARASMLEGTPIPISIQQKIERCLNETVQVLVERGLITSGEVLAKVLPQMTSGLRAAGIVDPSLRQIYAAIYRAFRRRRSLLLLNLENQVRIEELPWVAAIDQFRKENVSTRELARQTLEELTVLTLTSFPYVIIPNKLLQELRALAKQAELDIPLTDELAADIFMGEFSGKFVDSANRAAGLLDGTLYAIYYDIDYHEVRSIPPTSNKEKPVWPWQKLKPSPDKFAQLCASRAGVSLGTGDAATNGMIIEQQQILTSQNLAALYLGLGLKNPLRAQLTEMAKECFQWICRRQQMKIDKWHDRLIMLKKTAYAWRQMVFFLALLSEREIADFLRWAEDHLHAQTDGFQTRFRPALNGLALAAQGHTINGDSAGNAHRFLGWSKTRHWLTPGA